MFTKQAGNKNFSLERSRGGGGGGAGWGLECKGNSPELGSNPSSSSAPLTSISDFGLSPQDVLRSGHQKGV